MYRDDYKRLQSHKDILNFSIPINITYMFCIQKIYVTYQKCMHLIENMRRHSGPQQPIHKAFAPYDTESELDPASVIGVMNRLAC